MRQMTLALLVLAATTTGALAHSKAEQTTPANEATVSYTHLTLPTTPYV